MSLFPKQERQLDHFLVHEAPFQIPEDGREWLVKYIPWIVLLFLALDVLAAIGLVASGKFVGAVSHLSHMSLGLFFYPAVALGLVQIVLLGMCYSAVKAKERTGWELLFYYILIDVAIGVVTWLAHPISGLFGLVWALLLVVIKLYILFQIRHEYS
jgi:hypothetical protein